MSHTWSQEQLDIKVEFRDGNVHFIIRARAGTGKTTMIFEGIHDAPESKIRVCAFNKKIEQEGLRRLFLNPNPRADVKTIHAMGLAFVKTYWPSVRVAFDGARESELTDAVCGTRTPDTIKKLISKLHTKGREIAPHATSIGDLTAIQFNFELHPDEEWEEMGFGASYVEAKALEAMELAATKKPMSTGIDGSDMIFLPVRNQWLRKTHDLIVVDEAQDMTTAQLEIAVGSCRGRVVVVGDDRQAIYAFRGADSGSLDRLKAELRGGELPLTTTYRCGHRIVELAQQLVPDIKAGPNNPEGQILTMDPAQMYLAAKPGDFILSRLNAPLISVAMTLLRAGKRTKVAGRDIGAGLQALVRKLKARTVEDFLARLAVWEEREVRRLLAAKRERLVDGVRDRAAMLFELSELSEGADSVQAISDRIEALFTDDGLGDGGLVLCSSVHKAKGLEADRVFILKDTLRSHNQEEVNIEYVAITRAKNTLVWVPDIQ